MGDTRYMATTLYNATSRFSGKCESCIYPVVQELPDETRNIIKVSCPGCTGPVRLARLYGTMTDFNCDASCQNALGSECECGCGGANHQRGYLPLVPGGEVSADVLTAYRKRVANIAAGVAKRAENKKAARAQAEAEAQAALAANVTAFVAANPAEWSWLSRNAASNGFADSLLSALNRYGYLTDPQLNAVTKNVARDAERAAEALLPVTPAPSGVVTLTGEILTVRDQPGFAYNTTEWKMLVKTEAGWKTWLSVPRSLQGAFFADSHKFRLGEYDGARSLDGLAAYLVGATVTLTAEIEPSEKDPAFAYGRRPRKATILQTVAA